MSSKEIKEKSWQERNLLNKLVYNWIITPLGVLAILAIVIAINQFFKGIGFVFPANVASMLIVSLVLILSNYLLPKTVINTILKCLNPAVNFLMNWMIIFFLPPLITIVNSTVLPSGLDILKIIIVFFLGLLIFIPLVGYTIHYMAILFDGIKKKNKNKNEKMKNDKNEQMIDIVIEDDDNNEEEKSSVSNEEKKSMERDITLQMEYIKKSEMNENENKNNGDNIQKQKSSDDDDDEKSKTCKISTSFSWKSSAIPSKHNIITYLILFAVSWIPAIAWGVMQPLHITINVLSYFLGLCFPDKIRILFHPLISCTLFSYFFLWITSLILGHTFTEELDYYSNGSKYLLYINNTDLPTPEAGEILFCILDATVVALSFRIFEHHKLIIKHLFELVGSIIVMSFVSMLIHTVLCRILSVTPLYALSMTSRSATTPLAVQVVDFLHSNMAIAIVVVAFTGVFTDIIGLPLLKLIRFPLQDSLAHGACMGCAGHAVATAGLIKNYPSASAVSSISFVLFSTFCVIWSAIPPVASLFQTIAGI